MLVAAAVCPHPPALVPELAAGAAADLDTVRAACDEALRRLAAAGPDLLVVVGGDIVSGTRDGTRAASTARWGVDVRVGVRVCGHASAAADGTGSLPLSLTIGAWLLDRVPIAVPTRFQAVAPDSPTADCEALGAELAETAPRVALLVMGDGTATREGSSPGGVDLRARPFDDAVAHALATVDIGALASLDADLARSLGAAGRAAWQVLAGAADADPVLTGELLAYEAPYGVGYLVAAWSCDVQP